MAVPDCLLEIHQWSSGYCQSMKGIQMRFGKQTRSGSYMLLLLGQLQEDKRFYSSLQVGPHRLPALVLHAGVIIAVPKTSDSLKANNKSESKGWLTLTFNPPALLMVWLKDYFPEINSFLLETSKIISVFLTDLQLTQWQRQGELGR